MRNPGLLVFELSCVRYRVREGVSGVTEMEASLAVLTERPAQSMKKMDEPL
jgi:hypothetical protein